MSIAPFGAQARPCADPVDLSSNQPRRIFVFRKSKYLEFNARRSGVDDENCIREQDYTAATFAVFRRAAA